MQNVMHGNESRVETDRAPLMLLPMPMTMEQIVEETSQWPSDVVAELVDRIMLAKHGGMAPALDASWRPVITRRVEEIRSGKVQGIPGEVVSERIRRIVGR